MRTLYFDCFAGASGNMILGALLALGVDRGKLVAELQKLEIADFDLRVESVNRSGIASTHVDVRIPPEHSHRHLDDIKGIISGSSLSGRVKERAISIFTRLGEAEAKVHGIDVKKVHFHEVGALDAIVDVVGASIGFEMLGIEAFACSKIHVGSGFVEIAHGKFPVPPPAVTELLGGIPIYSTEIAGELMTPTGAAIISTVCDSYGKIPEMTVEQTGYGAGTRNYEKFPNVLRVIVGETSGKPGSARLTLLETNIDDASPQILGYVMEKAFAAGALDAWFTPIQMKKNRPATMLSILCEEARLDEMSELIYAETTTIGIHQTSVERSCLERDIVTVNCEFGTVDMKIARVGGQVINAMPEYEHVRRAAVEHDVPFKVVASAAVSAFEKESEGAAFT